MGRTPSEFRGAISIRSHGSHYISSTCFLCFSRLAHLQSLIALGAESAHMAGFSRAAHHRELTLTHIILLPLRCEYSTVVLAGARERHRHRPAPNPKFA